MTRRRLRTCVAGAGAGRARSCASSDWPELRPGSARSTNWREQVCERGRAGRACSRRQAAAAVCLANRQPRRAGRRRQSLAAIDAAIAARRREPAGRSTRGRPACSNCKQTGRGDFAAASRRRPAHAALRRAARTNVNETRLTDANRRSHRNRDAEPLRIPSLAGAAFRLVVPLTLDELAGDRPAGGEELVVYDELGAGIGSRIAFSEGGEAAQPFLSRSQTVDAYNAAILDRHCRLSNRCKRSTTHRTNFARRNDPRPCHERPSSSSKKSATSAGGSTTRVSPRPTTATSAIRLGENEVLCTPTMISKGFMKPDDLCIVDMEGKQLAGKRKRTSEILLHLAIMKERPDVKSVVHCHPPHATAFAVAREPIPQCVLPEVEVFLGDVPITSTKRPAARSSPTRSCRSSRRRTSSSWPTTARSASARRSSGPTGGPRSSTPTAAS